MAGLLLGLVRVVRLCVVALVAGVRVRLLLVAVRVLLTAVLLLVAGVRVRLLLIAVGGLGLRLGVRLLLRLGLPGCRGVLFGEGREVGEVVGVAGVLDGRRVVGEGAEIVGGDPAVQLLPAPSDRLQGLGEDRLEGAELDVDVVVGGTAQGLRVVAALGASSSS
ncbi:hypothetical protein SHKM778_20380 [Streptomyces sp. KM77-8]|uniref:Uncharacterized protein n=1 Tax=Streptomyces haneummycinicus TaxID=3074435 RepID=A0AAT9HDX2_9ACTN